MKNILTLFGVLLLLGSCATTKQPTDLDKLLKQAENAGGKWSDYGTLAAGNVADTDDFLIRDVSDTSLAATGTQKRYTWASVKSDIASDVTIDLATLASTLTLADDESTDDNHEVLFTTTPTGAAAVETDGDFNYNPSTGTLSITGVVVGSGGDAADSGVIRLKNADSLTWEASPTGTDVVGISVDSDEVVQIGSSGASGVTVTPDLNISGDTLRIATTRTPASASATGSTGEICWDSDYIYICVSTNSWKRMAISSW